MVLASGTADEAARAEAGVVPAGLFYSSDAEPGITQVLRGKTFAFRDSQGRWIRDAAEIARIRKLAIPPAYRSVWICASANGHPTVLALETLRKFCGPGGAGFTLKQLLGEVSQSLGNTPAVCRKPYIHPRVLELWCQARSIGGRRLVRRPRSRGPGVQQRP